VRTNEPASSPLLRNADTQLGDLMYLVGDMWTRQLAGEACQLVQPIRQIRIEI
jgi:hypothetical protein